MLAADVDDRFFCFVRGAEFALVPGADGFAERHDACGGGVLSFVFVDGFDGGFFDVVGRRKIRLAGTEVGDIHATRFQFVGFRNDRGGGRDLNAVDAVG